MPGSQRALLGLGLVAAALLALGETDLDLRLADWIWQAGGGSFAWRHAPLAESLLHDGLRRLMTLLGVVLIGSAVADAIRCWPGLGRLGRLRLRAAAGCAVAIPLAVALLKRLSSTHCPWDLARYGGTEPYQRLLEPAAAAAGAGHCFPAGHASSVLWLIGLAFVALPQAPPRAGWIAGAALAAGLVVGGVQQLRGAHFLSHTLWSLWIAAALYQGIYAVFARRLAAAEVDVPPTRACAGAPLADAQGSRPAAAASTSRPFGLSRRRRRCGRAGGGRCA